MTTCPRWSIPLKLPLRFRGKGIELHRAMVRERVEGNMMTRQLLLGIGKGGEAAVEDQQVATAALTAAVAAAGSLMIRAGAF